MSYCCCNEPYCCLYRVHLLEHIGDLWSQLVISVILNLLLEMMRWPLICCPADYSCNSSGWSSPKPCWNVEHGKVHKSNAGWDNEGDNNRPQLQVRSWCHGPFWQKGSLMRGKSRSHIAYRLFSDKLLSVYDSPLLKLSITCNGCKEFWCYLCTTCTTILDVTILILETYPHFQTYV